MQMKEFPPEEQGEQALRAIHNAGSKMAVTADELSNLVPSKKKGSTIFRGMLAEFFVFNIVGESAGLTHFFF